LAGLDALKDQYVDKEKLNDKKMFYGAIKACVFLKTYTVLWTRRSRRISDDLAGTFEASFRDWHQKRLF